MVSRTSLVSVEGPRALDYGRQPSTRDHRREDSFVAPILPGGWEILAGRQIGSHRVA